MANHLLAREYHSRTSQVPILDLFLPKGLLLEEGNPEELLEGSLRMLLVVSRKLQELLIKVSLKGLLLEESSLVGRLKGRLQVLLRVLPEDCLPRGKLKHCFKGLLHLKRILKCYLTRSLKMWFEE